MQGEDKMGQFRGLAFHIQNEKDEAVYFRPFVF